MQQQNSSIGRLILLMSALQDENQILNVLNLEEKKRAIDERIVHNEKLSDKRIENGEDVSEDYAAARQELLEQKSDIKTQKKRGSQFENLEDAEQRLADVRASVAADKSIKSDTSPQKSCNQTKSKKNTMIITRMTAKGQKIGLDHSQ